MRTLVLLAAAGMLSMAGAGLAHLTTCGGTVITVVTPAGTFYYDDRGHNSALPPVTGLQNGHGTWVYMESNGVPGLQRGGASIVFGALVSEIAACNTPNPDALIL